ncbi:MAG: hypothetical protein AAFN74_05230 [Myxococcota bacterium]
MTIDQATLSAGVAGYARSDGVPGQLVTITASATGTTYALYLRSVAPVGDTAPVLTKVSDRVWTFTPPAIALGRTYRLELVVDEGRATESRQARVFSIPSRNQGFTLPAPGERASPLASLQNMGADMLNASERNAGGQLFGSAQAILQLFQAVDALLGNVPLSRDVVGTTFELAGSFWLDAGIYRAPRASLSAVANAAEIEFRRNSDNTVLTTLSRTGVAPGWVTASAGFTLTAPDGVDIYLRNSNAGDTASVHGVQMRFELGAPVVV